MKLRDAHDLKHMSEAASVYAGEDSLSNAGMFGAALEYVRDGRLEIQQAANFKEILVRRARPKSATTGVILGEGERNDHP